MAEDVRVDNLLHGREIEGDVDAYREADDKEVAEQVEVREDLVGIGGDGGKDQSDGVASAYRCGCFVEFFLRGRWFLRGDGNHVLGREVKLRGDLVDWRGLPYGYL